MASVPLTPRRLARSAGAAAAVGGLLVAGAVAGRLWGTGMATARAQAALRAALALRVAQARHLGATPGPSATAPAGAPAQDASVPEPAPAPGTPIARIQIPAIGLDMVVVEGVGDAELAEGPGHYPGTPMPGEAGNVAIAGHRTTHLAPFFALTAVPDGAPIVLTSPQGVFVYRVSAQSVVPPSDVAVLAPTAVPTLTLTTCTPRYSAAMRLVLRAVLESAPGGLGAQAPLARPGLGAARRPTGGPVTPPGVAPGRG